MGIQLVRSALLLTFALASPAGVAEAQDGRAKDLLHHTPMEVLGLPDGVHPSLAQHSELWGNLRGGRRQLAVYTGLLQFGLSLELDTLLGTPAPRVFVQGLWLQGQNISKSAVGDAGVVSNIAGRSAVRMFLLGAEQVWSDGAVALKLGLLAVDEDFMVLEHAALFINSGPGNMQTFALNVSAPIYPLGGLGARLALHPIDSFAVQLGVYDGNAGLGSSDNFGLSPSLSADGSVLFIGELTGRLQHRNTDRLRISFGVYTHLGVVDDYAGHHQRRGLAGLYAMGEARLWTYRGSHLRCFLHAGLATPSRHAMAVGYLDAGLHLTGGAFRRPMDDLGLAWTFTRFGPEYLRSTRSDGLDVSGSEHVLEFTYRLAVLPWVHLQPTLQWVHHPHYSLRDALVAGLRLSVRA